jgi:serine/threonine protein kinase
MNDYQIVQDVGRSKYSLVYKGRKKKTVMFYALKCVDKSQKRKIMHEVKFLREFSRGFRAWNAPEVPRSCLRCPTDFISRIQPQIHSQCPLRSTVLQHSQSSGARMHTFSSA